MQLPTLDAAAQERAADPRVSVVIASRDRSALLQRTLGRLADLPDPPAVRVVDDGSRDDTVAAVALRFPGVAVTSLATSRGAAARNVGVERAPTPYVALTDDDAHWAPGALELAADVLDAHPELALVAPRILVGPQERLDPVCALMAAGGVAGDLDLPGQAVLGFVACGAVVRRSAFLEVGGFARRYGIGGEERRLALDLAAAGWGLRYMPWVVAHHDPPRASDRPARRATTLRNDLWTAWLRRPAGAAARESVRLVRRAGGPRDAAAGVGAALAGAAWVARERRVVPLGVEGSLRALERSGALGR